MENLDNLKRVRTAEVEDGEIVLKVPKLESGTEVKVRIVSTEGSESIKNGKNHVKANGKTLEDKEVKTIDQNRSFDALGLEDELLEAVADSGYKDPTPIQRDAIPPILQGNDVLATAQTGSGKTAAFVLPMLQKLNSSIPKKKNRYPRALILAPTRELAIQVADSVHEYGRHQKLYHVTIYGGVSQRPQVKKLRRGVDMIIATPGRLLDLVNQGHIKLEKVEIFILDEADRMLDMGFLPDIKRVIRGLPSNRQTLMFSATMPDQIGKLAKEIQNNPIRISVDPPSKTVETVDSYLYHVNQQKKIDLLDHFFQTKPEMRKVLIFRRTKYNCDKLAKQLKQKGYYADRIHGGRSQNQREQVLEEFRDGDIDILIGTDVAARGLDVDDISHVINFEITNEPEVYVHRVGRTARAGKSGVALNLCSRSEEKYIRDIERFTGEKMIIAENYPHQSEKHRGGNKKTKSNRKNHYKKNKQRSSKKQYHKKKK